MSVNSKCVLVVEAPLAEAFSKFSDYSTWNSWMPDCFRPVKGPSRPLQKGDAITVKIEAQGRKLNAPMKILRLAPNREIAWGGGVPGVLTADHAFFFEEMEGGRTRIRSDETFTGLLTMPRFLQKIFKKDMDRIGEAQLSAFGAWIKKAQAA